MSSEARPRCHAAHDMKHSNLDRLQISCPQKKGAHIYMHVLEQVVPEVQQYQVYGQAMVPEVRHPASILKIFAKQLHIFIFQNVVPRRFSSSHEAQHL